MQGMAEVLNWSFPVLRLRRLTVAVGWLLPVWMLFDLVRAAQAQAWALVIAALFVPPLTMLLHALAHVWMARRVGGDAERTVISILVDSTDFSLPLKPWAHLLTGLAGPVANLLVLAAALALPRWLPATAEVAGYVAWVNGGVGVLNLLACAPFDGQRIWRGILWLFVPMRRAVNGAVILGFASAVLMIALAAWFQSLLLLFCGITSLLATIADRRMVAAGSDPIFLVDPTYAGSAPASAWSRRREQRRRDREERELAEEQEILDRLLAKVSAQGLPALTAGERKHLQRISQRQKQRQGA